MATESASSSEDDRPAPAKGDGGARWPRSGKVAAGVVAGVVLAATGLFVALRDDDDPWQSACGGLLADIDDSHLFGTDDWSSEDAGDPESTKVDQAYHCSLYGPGDGTVAQLDVQFEWGNELVGLGRLADLNREASDRGGQLVSPVGHSWQAVLNTGAPIHRALVVLNCRDTEPLAVTVRAYPDPTAPEKLDDARRAALADLVTGTAAKAAERWGCQADFGQPVRSVPPVSPKTLVADGEATGTCRGVEGPVYETAARRAPVEDCLLADASGTKKFRLSAYYGPLTTSARTDTIRGDSFQGASGGTNGVYWTTASRPQGPAMYTVETLNDGDTYLAPAPERQRSALAEFASRSSKRHGCEPPEELPPGS